MSNFSEFKKKAAETVVVIADKAEELAKIAKDKAVIAAKMAKLSAEMAADKEKIAKTYMAIGKKYYELHRSDAEDEFIQAIADISLLKDSIDVKRVEMAELKESFKSECGSDIEVEIYEEPCCEEGACCEEEPCSCIENAQTAE